MEYRLLIDLETIALLDGLSKAKRRHLLNHFAKIRAFPSNYSDYHEQDAVGERHAHSLRLVPITLDDHYAAVIAPVTRARSAHGVERHVIGLTGSQTLKRMTCAHRLRSLQVGGWRGGQSQAPIIAARPIHRR